MSEGRGDEQENHCRLQKRAQQLFPVSVVAAAAVEGVPLAVFGFTGFLGFAGFVGGLVFDGDVDFAVPGNELIFYCLT
jgi:hypothetical protein